MLTHDITETTYHDPVAFRSHTVVYNKPEQSERQLGYRDVLDKRHDTLYNDMLNQHNKLDRSQEYLKHPLVHDAIRKYTGFDSKYINRHLTGLNPLESANNGDLFHTMRHLEHGFKHLTKPLEEDVHTYSGLKEWVPSVKEGDVFHTPAYISSSIHPSQTKIFAHQNSTKDDNSESHVLHFHLPKGFKNSLYIGDTSKHFSEREMLLNKDQKWKVTKIKSYNQKTVGEDYITKKKRFSTRKTHIYTVVPHDEQNQVNETTEHSTIAFRNIPPTLTKFMGDDSHYTKQKIVHDQLEQLYKADIKTQHTRLVKHFGGDEVNPKIERDKNENITNPINKYTTSSGALDLNASVLHHFIPTDTLPLNLHRDKDTAYPIEKIHEFDEHLDSITKPLPEDIHVYSGAGHRDVSSVKEGDVFHTPAYTSTSINPRISKAFSSSKNDIFHFHLPKGSQHGAYIAGYSMLPREKEFLLKRDQKWKVAKIKKYPSSYGGYRVISVVPHHENVQEAFIHNPNRVEDAIKGNHVRQLLDARLSSLVIPAHPKINKNSDEAKSLSNYSQSSTAVNNALIAKDQRYLNGHKDDKALAPKTYQGIKRVFDQAEPLSHEQHVYSGTGHWDPLHKNTNGLIHTPAFTSTSHSISTARGFAAGGTILHFHLPKGYNKAINMRHHSEYPFEKEVLLDHGQTWKIHAVQNVSSEYGGTVKVVTVKPHVENVQEAFEHNPNDKVFKNTNKQGIEKFPLENRDKEHKLLKSTHIVPLEHREAIRHYGEGSSSINMGIIDGKLTPSGKLKTGTNSYFIASALKTHKSLLNMFQKHPSALTREHHVYSGLGIHDPSKFTTKGGVFKMPAYTSTSTRPGIAIQHSNTNRFEETNTYELKKGQAAVDHVLHFHLPKGYTGGKYIQGHTDYNEHEMLLAPNQKWRVVNKQTVTGKAKADIYGNSAHKVERHIWTVVPHEDNKYLPKPITEAYEHNPKTDLLRFTPTVNSMHWSEKHRNLVNNLRTDHENRTNEEHEALLDIHDHHSSDIKDYTQESSHLNYHLISPHDSHPDTAREMDDMAHDVSHAIRVNTAPLERDHHVYSGISYGIKPEIGKVLHTPAFTSTSIDINRAARFAPKSKDILHFHLPKGYTKGIYIAGNSDHPDEREFLLDHGQKWKVTNIAHHHNDIQMDKQRWGGNFYNKYRIISLKPHDENVNEATFHSTMAFRDQSNKHTDLTGDRPIITNKTQKHTAYQKMKNNITDNVDADSRDQHERLKEHFSHLPHHSPITNYTNDSDSSKAHNKAAIAMHSDPTSLEPFADEVHKLSNTIKEHSRPLPEDVHAYSGIKWDPRGTLEVGKTVHLPAFTSTTIDPEVSTGYTESHHEPAFDHMHYLHFHLPKGYNKGVYAAGVSQYHNEKEYLLDKDQHWKVTGHKKLTVKHDSFTKYPEGEAYKYECKNYHHVWTLEPHDDK